jgi:hypothetical protein
VLVVPGTSHRLDVYLDVNFKQNLPQYHAEACDYPFLFDFLQAKNNFFSVGMHTDPNQADVVQLLFFLNLVKSFDHIGKIKVLTFNGKEKIVRSGFRSDEWRINKRWYKVISDLADIQKATGQRMPIPKGSMIYPSDLKIIELVKNIIETGELVLPNLDSISFTMHTEALANTIELFKKSGRFKMKINLDKTSEQILGTEIQLGPVTYELPEMRFKEPIAAIEAEIETTAPNAQIEVTFVPFSVSEVKFTYSNWKKT